MNGYSAPPFPDPPREKPQSRFSRRTVWIVCAIVVGVLAFGTGGLVAVMRNPGTTNSAISTSTVASSPRPIPSTLPQVAAPTTIPAVPSFDQISQFVRTLYAALPANTDLGWTLFDAHYSSQFSKQSYVQFWSTIRSVTVVSATPRDATTVIVRLTYLTQTGNRDTEDRSISVISKQGQLFVYDSRRLGPA